MTYAMYTENMDAEAKAEFDGMLAGEVAAQPVAPRQQSSNVGALMGMFKMPQRGQ